MNSQIKYSSYRKLSSRLKKSEDSFEIQALTEILDEYNKNHEHDFKAFESIIRQEREIRCPKCNSTLISKNGKDKNGIQRYKCRQCQKNFNIATDTLLFSSKINLKTWFIFLEYIVSGTSIKAACFTAKISAVTGSFWMKKAFKGLEKYQDTIVLDSVVYIDETYVHEDSSKIEYKDEIGKVKKVKKQPRGISKNKICVLIATDKKSSFAEIVCHGRPRRLKNYEICKRHIVSGSVLIGDEDTSLTYTANEMGLQRKMYKSNTEEAYKELEPIDQLCSRYKLFWINTEDFKKIYYKITQICLFL